MVKPKKRKNLSCQKQHERMSVRYGESLGYHVDVHGFYMFVDNRLIASVVRTAAKQEYEIPELSDLTPPELTVKISESEQKGFEDVLVFANEVGSDWSKWVDWIKS